MGAGRLGLPVRPPAAQGEGMGAGAPGRPEVRAERDAAARGGVRAAQGEAMASSGERLRAMGGEEGGNNHS